MEKHHSEKRVAAKHTNEKDGLRKKSSFSVFLGGEKTKTPETVVSSFFGDSSEIRTPDPLIKSQVLYRLS